MRLISTFTVLVCAALTGCIMPRPWLAPNEAQVCKPASAPMTGELLVASFRLPDCRNGTPRWTAHRSGKPHFSVADRHHRSSVISETDWFNELAARGGKGDRAPVIYIHGYFNDQDDALDRALAIRALLCPKTTAADAALSCVPKRPVIALTWPSHNVFAKYVWDEANSEWSERAATKLILTIADKHPGTILVAHSMGNRILVAAALAAEAAGKDLGQLVLASPDVDRGYMAELLGRDQGLGFPATIYASLKDQALSTSWRTHGYPRAGDLSNWVSGRAPGYPYVGFKNAAIVDTTRLSAGLTAHAAFIDAAEAAADLCHVLSGDAVKPGRVKDAGYAAYWVLRPGVVDGDPCATLAAAAVEIANPRANVYPDGVRRH